MSVSSNATRSVITNRIGLRLASAAAAAVLAGAMFVPGSALAADWIQFGDDKPINAGEYSVTSNDGTWTYDGANTITFNNYNGVAFTAQGEIEVIANGENTFTGNVEEYPVPDEEVYREDEEGNLYNEANEIISTHTESSMNGITVRDSWDEDANESRQNGNLTISGPGTITVKAGSNATNLNYATGISVARRFVVDGATVNVNLQNVLGEDGWQAGITAESMTMRNGANVNVTSTSQLGDARGISIRNNGEEVTSLIDDSALTVEASSAAMEVNADWDVDEEGNWSQVAPSNLTIKNSEVSLRSTNTFALDVEGTLTIDNSDLDAVSAKNYFAVEADKIVLSQESGDIVVVETPYGRFVLTTNGFDFDSDDDSQNEIHLRRTGETPKHLRATASATASATKGGLAQTGDPFNPAPPLGMAAGAVAMLGAAKHLRRREDEE